MRLIAAMERNILASLKMNIGVPRAEKQIAGCIKIAKALISERECETLIHFKYRRCAKM